MATQKTIPDGTIKWAKRTDAEIIRDLGKQYASLFKKLSQQ